MICRFAKKYLAPTWCWLWGHDVIYPYENRKYIACVRCGYDSLEAVFGGFL